MGRCICLCTYCEHHRPIEVQWAGGYHQLGHNEHRVPWMWPLERCRPPGKFWETVILYTGCIEYRILYTGSRYDSQKPPKREPNKELG